MKRKQILSWCLFDWANSAFPTLVSTFVFSVYFTQAVAETPADGTAAWSFTMGIAALIIAVFAPMLGAIADRAGRRKPWLFILCAIVTLSSVGLWVVAPEERFVMTALVLVAAGTIAFELSMVFYNAMLTDVAPDHMTGRISGWGWGLGYAGGLAALAISLVFLILPDVPVLGLDTESSEHIRAIPVLAGLWLAIFAIPLFLFVPDKPGTGITIGQAVRDGLVMLWGTLKSVRQHALVFRFLIARMFYTDGLNTLFAMGGIFAAAAYGMDTTEVLFFGIALNVTAGLGAAGFAFLDDRWGAKPVILISVGAITLLGIGMLLSDSKPLFWALGLGLGIFLGPAQAASRSMMARLSPETLKTEFFGLYALSGKATAFAGPLLFALVVESTGNQYMGMATILPFLIIGFVLMARLKLS